MRVTKRKEDLIKDEMDLRLKRISWATKRRIDGFLINTGLAVSHSFHPMSFLALSLVA